MADEEEVKRRNCRVICERKNLGKGIVHREFTFSYKGLSLKYHAFGNSKESSSVLEL